MRVRVLGMFSWLNLYPKKGEAILFITLLVFHSLPFPCFSRNLKSVTEFLDVASDKVKKEVQLGRMAVPYSQLPFPDLKILPLGVVPKQKPGKFCLIHNFFHPKGESISDGISKV